MNSVKLQDTILIHRNLLYSYTLTTKDQKEKLNLYYPEIVLTLYAITHGPHSPLSMDLIIHYATLFYIE